MRTKREKNRFARELRKNPTFCEERLAKSLRAVGVSFGFNEVVYGFIPDFFFPQAMLAVEVDGSVHDLPEVKANDRRKETVFARGGIRILRFTNERVMRDLGAVVREICAAIGHVPFGKKPKGARKRRRAPRARLMPVRRFHPGPNLTAHYPVPDAPKKAKALKIVRKNGEKVN